MLQSGTDEGEGLVDRMFVSGTGGVESCVYSSVSNRRPPPVINFPHFRAPPP